MVGCAILNLKMKQEKRLLSSWIIKKSRGGPMGNDEKKTIVYTAQSKYYYFAKQMITKYVLEHDAIPLNPFNNWSYFMNDMVERDLVIRANANLIFISDEIWSFGPIADGVLAEIRVGMASGKRIRFFSVGKSYCEIQEIGKEELVFETELLEKESRENILEELFGI